MWDLWPSTSSGFFDSRKLSRPNPLRPDQGRLSFNPEGNPVEEKNWAPIALAAEIKNVNERTIRNWIAAGLIEAEKLGPRMTRVNLNSIQWTPVEPEAHA